MKSRAYTTDQPRSPRTLPHDGAGIRLAELSELSAKLQGAAQLRAAAAGTLHVDADREHAGRDLHALARSISLQLAGETFDVKCPQGIELGKRRSRLRSRPGRAGRHESKGRLTIRLLTSLAGLRINTGYRPHHRPRA